MDLKKMQSAFFVLAAGCLWGILPVFVRVYNESGLDSFAIVEIRAVATTVLLLFYLGIFDRAAFRIRMKDIWCFLGTGLCSILFFNVCYFSAVMITSMSVAAVLLYTSPAFIILLSFFIFKEKITKQKLLSVVFSIVGCAFVTGVFSGSPLSVVGILFGLGSALGYALYSIFSRFALEKGYSSITITFYTFLIVSIGCLPLCSRQMLVQVALADTHMIGYGLLFGLLSTVAPYLLYTKGLEHLENGKAGIIAAIEPVVASVIGILFFGESMSIGVFSGIILVFIGIVLSVL